MIEWIKQNASRQIQRGINASNIKKMQPKNHIQGNLIKLFYQKKRLTPNRTRAGQHLRSYYCMQLAQKMANVIKIGEQPH
jgi:hypothetical protein